MANELAIGLVIGATLKGVNSAFGETSKLVNNLGRRIGFAQQMQARFGRMINRGASEQTHQLGRLERRYADLGKAILKAQRSQESLNKAMAAQKAHTEKRQAIRGQLAETGAHALALGMPVWKSVKTYMEQEDAATNLKIAMLRADGTFGKFNEISKIANDLGRDLPGTRTDFYNLSLALKKQGISDDILTHGGLATAAKLNVLLDMDPNQGGEFLAKFMESHGLQEQELGNAADYLQRAMFAGGLTKDQMYESMKYYAPKLNSLGLTGAQNTEKVLAIEAMAGQQGLEGSTFGTGLNIMLSRMNKGPEMLRMATKGMKAEAQDMIKATGVEFNFWDKKGKFKGVEGMLSEMQKFEKIRAKYGDKGVGLVAEELFGIEGGRLADILAKKGQQGLDDMLKKMRDQADLQERIRLKTSTLSAALEALGGVWESAVGTLGSAFADDIKTFANQAQGFIENTLTPWIENNKGLIKTFVGIGAGLLGFKMAKLAVAYSLNLLFSPFKTLLVFTHKVNAAFNLLRLIRLSAPIRAVGLFGRAMRGIKQVAQLAGQGVSWFARGALSLGRALGGVLVRGVMLAGRAVLFLGRALLMNPIGLIITGIAVAAYLIYQYWEPIKAFFSDLWQSVTNAFQWASTSISQGWNALSSWFGSLWDSLSNMVSQGINNIGNWISQFDPLSLFQNAFNAVLNWFSIDLPASFNSFGHNLIDGLVSGISSAWDNAKESVLGLGRSIKSWFTGEVEIHSPSRVFKGYGINIIEGLVQGLDKTRHAATGMVSGIGASLVDAMPTQISAPVVAVVKRTKQAHQLGKAQRQAITPIQPTHFEHYSALQDAQAEASDKGHSTTPSSIVVNFNPTINLGNAPQTDVKNVLMQALQEGAYEFEQLLRRVVDQQQRRAY